MATQFNMRVSEEQLERWRLAAGEVPLATWMKNRLDELVAGEKPATKPKVEPPAASEKVPAESPEPEVVEGPVAESLRREREWKEQKAAAKQKPETPKQWYDQFDEGNLPAVKPAGMPVGTWLALRDRQLEREG